MDTGLTRALDPMWLAEGHADAIPGCLTEVGLDDCSDAGVTGCESFSSARGLSRGQTRRVLRVPSIAIGSTILV